jgi:probable addiction module antidote protein
MKRSVVGKKKDGVRRSHAEATLESFRRNPRFAAEYMNAVLEDGDREELLVALRYMASAFGGVSGLARKADLNATTLYRTLSPKGNPELKSLTAVLDVMGLRLGVSATAARRKPSLGLNAVFAKIVRRAHAEVRRGKVTSLAQVKNERGAKAARR